MSNTILIFTQTSACFSPCSVTSGGETVYFVDIFGLFVSSEQNASEEQHKILHVAENCPG